MNLLQARILSCCLLLAFPCATLTAEENALVRSSGTVRINGKQVVQSSILVGGDKLEDGSNSAAYITSAKTQITAAARTNLQYHETAIDLMCGDVQVMTMRGFAVNVGSITVRPLSDAATRFEVWQGAGKMRIRALDNAVKVEDGAESTTVTAGNFFEKANSAKCAGLPASYRDAMIAGLTAGAATAAVLLTINGGRRASVTPSVP